MPQRQTVSLAKAPRTVIGYHGCSRTAAEAILAENQFVYSTNAYDWLGQGVYFWEYAPYRALNWAIAKCASTGVQPAVVSATIRLGRCLNLLDIESSPGLRLVYEQIKRNLINRRLPRNTETGAHFFDCEVIDSYCRLIADENSYALQTVRGCYPEGIPLFEGSKILSLTHVQVAVRDPACISRVRLVEFP